MGVDDSTHDGEAEPGAAGSTAIPPPKPTENQLALRGRDAWSFVADFDDAAAVDTNFDSRARRGMTQGIFHEVAYRTPYHFGVAFHPDRLRRAGQGYASVLPQRQRCHGLDNLAADRGEVGVIGLGHYRSVEFSDLQ